MHHRTDSDSGKRFNLHTIFFDHIGSQISITILHSEPYGVNAVSPEIVGKLVFPFVRTLGNRTVILIYQYSLDAGRPEFYSEHCLTLSYCFFSIHDQQGLAKRLVEHVIYLIPAKCILELRYSRVLVYNSHLYACNLSIILPIFLRKII